MSVFQADLRPAAQRQTWTKTTVKCKLRTVYIYSVSQCIHCVLIHLKTQTIMLCCKHTQGVIKHYRCELYLTRMAQSRAHTSIKAPTVPFYLFKPYPV